ncbi:MAG: phosphopantetheine-binding protein [Mycoplasma sp.]
MNKNMNKQILNIINKVAKEHNYHVQLTESNKDKTLKELGLDSLTTVSIIVGVENELKVRIPEDILGQIKTLEQLVDVLEAAKKD